MDKRIRIIKNSNFVCDDQKLQYSEDSIMHAPTLKLDLEQLDSDFTRDPEYSRKKLEGLRKKLTIKLRKSKNIQQLSKIISQHTDVFDLINTSTAMYSVGRILTKEYKNRRYKSNTEKFQNEDCCYVDTYNLLIGIMTENFNIAPAHTPVESGSAPADIYSIGGQVIANSLWGLSQGFEYLKLHEKLQNFGSTYNWLSEKAVENCASMNAKEISSVLCSISKVSPISKKQSRNFAQILNFVVSKEGTVLRLGVREISNILWASTKLEISFYCLRILVDCLKLKWMQMSAQDVSHTLCALKKHRYCEVEMLCFLEVRTLELCDQFSAQDIGTILLAFADLGMTTKRQLINQNNNNINNTNHNHIYPTQNNTNNYKGNSIQSRTQRNSNMHDNSNDQSSDTNSQSDQHTQNGYTNITYVCHSDIVNEQCIQDNYKNNTNDYHTFNNDNGNTNNGNIGIINNTSVVNETYNDMYASGNNIAVICNSNNNSSNAFSDCHIQDCNGRATMSNYLQDQCYTCNDTYNSINRYYTQEKLQSIQNSNTSAETDNDFVDSRQQQTNNGYNNHVNNHHVYRHNNHVNNHTQDSVDFSRNINNITYNSAFFNGSNNLDNFVSIGYDCLDQSGQYESSGNVLCLNSSIEDENKSMCSNGSNFTNFNLYSSSNLTLQGNLDETQQSNDKNITQLLYMQNYTSSNSDNSLDDNIMVQQNDDKFINPECLQLLNNNNISAKSNGNYNFTDNNFQIKDQKQRQQQNIDTSNNQQQTSYAQFQNQHVKQTQQMNTCYIYRNQLLKLLVNNYLYKCSNRKADIWAGFNIVYALSILQAPLDLCQQVVDKLVTNLDKKLFSFKNRGQILQTHFQPLCQLRRAQLQYQISNKQLILPEEIQQLVIRAMRKQVELDSHRSHKFLRIIFQHVKSNIQCAQKRVRTKSGELLVDIGIKRQFQQRQFELGQQYIGLGLQVAGYGAFTVNRPRKLLGSVEAYYQILERQGWKLIVVTNEDWDNLQFREELIQGIKKLCGG